MAKLCLPSQDVLDQLICYEPKTGELLWRSRDSSFFNSTKHRTAEHTARIWNTRYAGKPALSAIGVQGYREGHLLDVHVKSHRVIFKMMTGEEPDQIDHINGDRSDNRWGNLRAVDNTDNQKNAKRRKDNSSGVVGVTWYPHERANGTWLAKIGGKYLGFYDSFDDAVAARRAAEVEQGYHKNHGR